MPVLLSLSQRQGEMCDLQGLAAGACARGNGSLARPECRGEDDDGREPLAPLSERKKQMTGGR